MKIGIFDPYLDTLGGGEKYILTIAMCLAKLHNIFIFWDPKSEKEIKETAHKKLDIDLTSVQFTQNIFSPKYSSFSRLILSKNYDFIIFLSDGSIPFVLSKLIIHFQFPVEWVNISPLITKFKLLRIQKIICNSVFTKSFIDKKFGINSTVLYPPVFIQKKNIKKENIILHVGRFGINVEGVNYKKQDIMVEVFKKMIKGGLRDWKFVLFINSKKEDQGELDKLKERAKGFPIEIIDNADNALLWEFYNKSKIYWHASGFGEDLGKYPEKAEHFGIATVEAMGAGCVPVVINAGGQKEIVENEKSGFLWNTIDELIEKTNKIMKDHSLWKKMSENAIIKSSYFTGDRFCQELTGLVT